MTEAGGICSNASHHSIVRHELLRFRGRELDTAGDGFLAAFDGPARAIRCACAVVGGLERLFADRGVRDLKGVPGEWRLFAVERESAG